MIHTIKIYPPIGIARLGNSTEGYFIGPEVPGEVPIPADGLRDAAGSLKRQAARFHLFSFDEAGKFIGEFSPEDAAKVTWTVHIANTKAAAEAFHKKSEPTSGLRNSSFKGDRNQLRLDPGAVSVEGINPDFLDITKSKATGLAKDIEVSQLFLDVQVKLTLGTVMTDDHGRLIVMAGFGESKSPVGANLQGGDFADHDGWYDDVADGLVAVAVTLKDGSQPSIVNAWVITAPPKYAPGLQSVVSLYDTLRQSAIDRSLMPSPFADANFKPSLTADIIPILTRAGNMRWVYGNGRSSISAGGFHRSFSHMPPANRQAILDRLSVPSAIAGEPGTGDGDMPRMWSDLYHQGANGTLTKTQYRMLEMWKDGLLSGDQPTPAGNPTPDGLTRAALEPCVGAAFFPGIEASWKLRDVFEFIEPFRLDDTARQPGDVSSQMSLPWQSDFLDCNVETADNGADLVWWPAQRPIAVLKAGADTYHDWARVSDTDPSIMGVDQMVSDWHKLGLVLLQENGRFEEVQRL